MLKPTLKRNSLALRTSQTIAGALGWLAMRFPNKRSTNNCWGLVVVKRPSRWLIGCPVGSEMGRLPKQFLPMKWLAGGGGWYMFDKTPAQCLAPDCNHASQVPDKHLITHNTHLNPQPPHHPLAVKVALRLSA